MIDEARMLADCEEIQRQLTCTRAEFTLAAHVRALLAERKRIMEVVHRYANGYPADVFPPDSTSLEARIGTVLRSVLGNLVEDLDGKP